MALKEISISSLDVAGQGGRVISNQFFRQEKETENLAVIFPGLNYTCHKPLLYYTTEMLLARRADVLQLWEDYTGPSYDELPRGDLARTLASDGQALLQVGRQQRAYTKFVLAGKSVGTLTMALLLSGQAELEAATTIWLTPLLHVPQVAEAARRIRGAALFAGGSQDSSYDQDVLPELKQRSNILTLTIPGGDHSLNIYGDPVASVRALSDVVHALAALLGRGI